MFSKKNYVYIQIKHTAIQNTFSRRKYFVYIYLKKYHIFIFMCILFMFYSTLYIAILRRLCVLCFVCGLVVLLVLYPQYIYQFSSFLCRSQMYGWRFSLMYIYVILCEYSHGMIYIVNAILDHSKVQVHLCT